MLWAGPEVEARLRFTDVGSKTEHIARARVADLCLDTAECNSHTTAAEYVLDPIFVSFLPHFIQCPMVGHSHPYLAAL